MSNILANERHPVYTVSDDLRYPLNKRSLFNYIESPIPLWFRVALVCYLFIYRVFSPGFSAAINDVNVDYIFLRSLVLGLEQLVLFFPILFMPRVGFFHVLAFPALLSIAYDLAFSPVHLVLPFVLSAKPMLDVSPSWATVLGRLSSVDYSVYNIALSVATIVFLISKYIGFLIVRNGSNSSALNKPEKRYAKYIPTAVIVFVSIAIAFGWLFIRARGGVEAQILSFNEGRYVTMQGYGVFTVIVKLASVALMLWIAREYRAVKNPVFIGLLIALLPVYWIVDGSRSSIMLLVLSLIIVYSFSSGKLPVKSSAIAALFAFLIFGLLGILRQNYSATEVDYSAFSFSNIGQWADASREETIKRASEEGDLAGFVAANEGEYLWGKSYLSVLAYPVPRLFWSDKPKNIFYYNAWVAFLGNSAEDSAPEIWGIPINEVSEAFWNFGWVGLIVVGLLIGGFLGKITLMFKRNSTSEVMTVIYLITLVYFTGGSRVAFYWIQYVVGVGLVIALAYFIKILKTHRF